MDKSSYKKKVINGTIQDNHSNKSNQLSPKNVLALFQSLATVSKYIYIQQIQNMHIKMTLILIGHGWQ